MIRKSFYGSLKSKNSKQFSVLDIKEFTIIFNIKMIDITIEYLSPQKEGKSGELRGFMKW